MKEYSYKKISNGYVVKVYDGDLIQLEEVFCSTLMESLITIRLAIEQDIRELGE